jgi:putative hemolysin
VDLTLLLLPLVAVTTLLALTVFVSASAAFSHLREERIERLVQRRVPGARKLASQWESRERLEIALLIFRATATATFAIAAYAAVLRLSPLTWIGMPVGISVTMGGVIFAQTIGSVWAGANPEKVALTLAPVSSFSLTVLGRFSTALITAYRPIVRRFAAERNVGDGPTSESNHEDQTADAEREASIRTDEELERRISRGVVNLENMAVREIMVPRPDIAGIGINADLRNAVDLVTRLGFSRIPLFNETLDDIRGVLYAKDLLAAMHSEPANGNGLEALARPAYLIPETKRLGGLLREFQERRVHIALVVDEYGSLVGLVTNEDVLEELVGEIDDEFTAREQLVEIQGPGTAIVDARAPVKTVNELFGVDLEAEGFDTLGGLIFDKFGRIPTVGETVIDDSITLKVLSIAGRRIRRVQVTQSEAPTPEPQNESQAHVA